MALPLEHIEAGVNVFKGSDFREHLNAMIDAINELQRGQSRTAPAVVHERPKIPVTITGPGSAPGMFEFGQVRWNNSLNRWSLVSGGSTHSEMGEARVRGGGWTSSAQHSLIGSVVYLEPGYSADGSGNPVYEFDAPPSIIPVNLTQTGGSDGGATSSATWTYTVKNLSNETLLTGASPKNLRPTKGPVLPATFGYVHVLTTGSYTSTYVLGLTNEVPDIIDGLSTDQDVVTNVTYSTSTHKLQQTKKTVRVFESDNEATSDIDTAEACDGT